MSLGRFIYVSPIWGLIIMTRRFVWQGHVYTERDGQIVVNGVSSGKTIMEATFYHGPCLDCGRSDQPIIMTEMNWTVNDFTINDYVRLFPLTSVFCEDIIHHVGKFLVSGEHGTYILG